MNRALRKLWRLPWADERNAVACAAQVVLETCVKKLSDDDQAGARTNSDRAMVLIDAWQWKDPGQYDKDLVLALREAQRSPVHYDVRRILYLCEEITTRGVTGDLTSNAGLIDGLMEELQYVPGVAEAVTDAMAKWRFFDATRRKKLDNELRAAFEAYWIAGEYAGAYRFVGAEWPDVWTPDFDFLDDTFGTSTTVGYPKIYLQGLITRNVQ